MPIHSAEPAGNCIEADGRHRAERRPDGNHRHAGYRARAGRRVIDMPAAVQRQWRGGAGRLPAVPLDINPRHAVGDVARRLAEEVLKHNLRRRAP